ncbi:UNVERIFIED_CONTAM: hypothetical protein GTU68_060994 [Idotea baltica]|nr:hypothetical protein [Idotea baltica]
MLLNWREFPLKPYHESLTGQ